MDWIQNKESYQRWKYQQPEQYQCHKALTADQQLTIIEHLQNTQMLDELFYQFIDHLSEYVPFTSVVFRFETHCFQTQEINADDYSYSVHLNNSQVTGQLIITNRTQWSAKLLSYIHRFVRLLEIALPKVQQIARLQYQLSHDHLTEVYSRQEFDTHLAQVIAQNERIHTGLQLLVCDIDRFKQINDLYGHLKGDKALRHIAYGLTHACRQGDHLSRIGGDEFAVILSPASPTSSLKVIERIKHWLIDNPLLPDIPLSLSCGYATWHPTMKGADLIHHADLAMYRHKIAS
ncbi:GGDEF domain-containing protein [Celerinatantimonas yamalensis]|uniref:diguanylate cyclase n=1 Tax=Celerinatantimonas yamalensis TaxID=559956 RepID=A0ABW9G852_9GAMM